MASKPTQRSLKHLRDLGYTVAIAEKYNFFTHRRNDLFGWMDICAIHPDKPGVLGVQTTSGSNLSARIKKAIALDSFKVWLQCGGLSEFHGWAKRGARGKRKLWTCRIEKITLKDLTKMSQNCYK